jgi:flavin-dependent dehydrogenase
MTCTDPSAVGDRANRTSNLSAIDLARACRTTWDVIVVGAGPAGALAARQTAKLGARTLLVDRATFPRGKVCGGCFNARSAKLLDGVGLGHLLPGCEAVPTRELELAMSGRSLRLPMTGGYALSRETFDAALIEEAIAAGAEFLPGTRALRSELHEDARATELSGEEGTCEVRARVLVAADGLGGRLLDGRPQPPDPSSRLGGGALIDDDAADYRPGTIYMGLGRDGYVGVVRVEGGRLNVAGAFDPAAVKRQGIPALADEVLRNAGLPGIDGLIAAEWRGTPLLTRQAEAVAGERILALGDATGYVEPVTGEGMAWAMVAAVAAAPLAVAGAQEWSPAIAHRWVREYRGLIARRTWFCRTITGLLRSPVATRSAMLAASMVPSAACAQLRWLDRLPSAASATSES